MSAIDWAGVHERLKLAVASIDEAANPSEAKVHNVLKERAKQLADAIDDQHDTSVEQLQVLRFKIGLQLYALETKHIHEVVPLRAFAVVPNTPDFVRGVINNHGELLVIVDLPRFLGTKAPGITDYNHVVVLGQDSPEFAILASRVERVVNLTRQQIKTAAEGALAGQAVCLGVTHEGLIVVDGAILRNDPRFPIDDQGER